MRFLILATLFLISYAGQAFTLVSEFPDQRGWGPRPLKFYVNRTNCPDNLDDYLQEAMDVWNSVPESSLKVEIGPDSTQTAAQLWGGTATDVPLIVCDANFSATASVDGDTTPGVGFLRGSDRDPVTNGGLLLNVESGRQSDINRLSDTLITVVVAHEIGHVLGIGHTSDKTALMYYDATAKKNFSLSQDDRNAVTFLYPRNELSDFDLIGGCGSISDAAGPGSFLGGNSLGLFTLIFGLYLAASGYLKRRRTGSNWSFNTK